METALQRRFLAALEPIAATAFFTPEVFEEYTAIGLDPLQGYFCSRAAPMGRPTPEAVTAAFYNWNPDLVRHSLRWDIAEPEVVLEARARGIRRALERLLPEDGTLPEAAPLVAALREAAAACPPEGRTLFAAHAGLPWPEQDLEGLWHGATLLREFRGDGHIAVLLSHDVGAVEALALHAAYTGAKPEAVFGLRMWDEDAQAAARRRLADRGMLAEDGSLSDAGWKFREMIERETDRLAAAPLTALGPERCEQVLAGLTPLGEGIFERKGVPGYLRRIATPVSPS